MTFIEALNNEETRSLIDLVEECISDLDRYPEGNPTLEEMRDDFISQLAALGYDYAA